MHVIHLSPLDNSAVLTRSVQMGDTIDLDGRPVLMPQPRGQQEFVLGYKSFEPIGPACHPRSA